MDYYVLTPVSFMLRILEFFSQFSLTLALLGSRKSVKNITIGAMIFAILFETGKLITPQYFNGFLSLVLGIPFITIYFKEKFWKVSISYLITGIVVALMDFVVLLSGSLIFGLEKMNNIFEDNVLHTICYIIMCLGVLGVAKIVSLLKKKDRYNFPKKSAISIVNNVCTFLLLIPNLIMLLYYYDGKAIPLILVIINICAIIAMFFISTYNTKKGFELVTAEQELITQRTYNKTLQNLVDGLRTFKHDYNNTLQTMYGYIQLGNMTGLKKFFEEILDESRAITALDKLNPELFKNPSLFGIITAKYEYAKQNSVNIDFEIYGELENADMQIYDLTRILGIFLDNAVEASSGSEKKKVNFMVSERKDTVIIEISNTYSEVSLKIEDMNKKGVSSKGENRGLGLYKVKEILKKYPKVKHETIALNGMFRQKMVINKVMVKV